eukprot:m.78565 g.78565  ORF g.78565 m.78565 type:complete len:99 (+) comp12539_c0_seq2:248-544(+)
MDSIPFMFVSAVRVLGKRSLTSLKHCSSWHVATPPKTVQCVLVPKIITCLFAFSTSGLLLNIHAHVCVYAQYLLTGNNVGVTIERHSFHKLGEWLGWC